MRMKFIILAAGVGSRVGRVGKNLHKALLPLDGQAIISHQLSLIPQHADIIIVTGYNKTQIEDFITLAHPSLLPRITFVHEHNWMSVGAGPGSSLLATRDAVAHDSFAYVACDTIWSEQSNLWDTSYSWLALAPIPAGSSYDRWCRVAVSHGIVADLYDKTPLGNADHAFTGLAFIHSDDAPDFWRSLATAKNDAIRLEKETRDVDGFHALISQRALRAQYIFWTDTGTEESYRTAVARVSGYDWTKFDQATYVMPHEDRVVKYMSDYRIIRARAERGAMLGSAVPQLLHTAPNMLTYEYVDGSTMYDYLDVASIPDCVNAVDSLLTWYGGCFTRPVDNIDSDHALHLTKKFYHQKSFARIAELPEQLRKQAFDALFNVNWDTIVNNVNPVHGHGDFNFGNIIYTDEYDFVGIDWREDFSGALWIDARYDLAKLLAGTVIHWGRARRGDFRLWPEGSVYRDMILDFIDNNTPYDRTVIETIGAISLLNSAPLHASPLDEILVARGAYWLDQIQ